MNVPPHIATIVDGNGRWAKAKGMPRNSGHAQGIKLWALCRPSTEEGRRSSMIKNLNQLKRRLRPGTRLEVTGHCRPGCIGQLREVTWVNTQGVYTKILNPPDPRINAANDGRGSIMWWGAASTWSFEDGVCSSYMNQTKTAETLIMAFRVLDEEAA